MLIRCPAVNKTRGQSIANWMNDPLWPLEHKALAREESTEHRVYRLLSRPGCYGEVRSRCSMNYLASSKWPLPVVYLPSNRAEPPPLLVVLVPEHFPQHPMYHHPSPSMSRTIARLISPLNLSQLGDRMCGALPTTGPTVIGFAI